MKVGILGVALLAVGALGAMNVAAQALSAEQDAVTPIQADDVDVGRDADQLRAVLKPIPDIDTTNTALVFNNPTAGVVWVRCAAFSGNGRILGGAALAIPANGVRFIYASDLADGRDFIGSAQCRSNNRVIPSAFILGSGLTDAPTLGGPTWQGNRMRFPIVASF
ncbi:MAG: hypothetical protein K0U93_11405 [Gammaproteobacteria bacterium]|nr:hypothetical protein [Gammaproteobacteria bacterium]